jgi:outer membrane protein assembly complex protein YaeT
MRKRTALMWPVRGAVLVLCATLGLSASPAKEWRVGKIDLTGNHVFPVNDIRSVMETRPASLWRTSLYSPLKLRIDLRSIESLYHENGYLEAKVTVSNIVYDTLSRRVALFITISEGPLPLIDSVAFIGKTVLAESELRNSLIIKKGNPLSGIAMRKNAEAITNRLAARGYLKAIVTDSIQVSAEQKKASVLFVINQGPLCFAGPLHLQGLSGVRPEVVKRELLFSSGDTLVSGAISNSIRDLYGTGLFDFVLIEPFAPDSAADTLSANDTLTAPVSVTLVETKFFTIDASAGYGTYDHFRATLRTAYANLFGLGHAIALDGTINRFIQRAELGYAVPWIFSTPLRAEVSTYVERHAITYRGVFEGVRFSLVPRQPEHFSYRLWGRYEKTEYIETFRDTAIEPKNTQSVGVDFTYDGLQSGKIRKRGVLLRCAPELAGLGGSGSNQYYRGLIDLRGYFNPQQSLRLSAALCAGYSHGYGAYKSSVPPQARYYIGSEGLRPVRGYATDTVGGTFVLVINFFELSIPVYKWIGITLFSDGGYAWESLASARLRDTRWVAGPGLSIKTPLGELRADFAYLLNGRQGWGMPFFSIGSTF